MLLAVVPAYNEASTIGSVLQSLFDHVDEVVVVDDGSTDKTYEQARQTGATVLRHALNRGQGAALETGHEYARALGAEYVLHFDADGQFDAADIRPALEKLKNTAADILLGSRFLDGRSNVPWLKRRVFLPLARLWHNLIYRSNLTDIHNGFRLLNRRALQALRLTQDRMAHASEISVQAARAELTIVEFPVKVTYHQYGQKAKDGLTVLKDLIFANFIR